MNPALDAIVRKHITWNFPYLGDIERKTVLALVNTHPSYDVAEPLPPNTIPIGGLQIVDAKPLPQVYIYTEPKKYGKQGHRMFAAIFMCEANTYV